MTPLPILSIIIPTINEEETIEKVIRSIPKNILPPTEIILVDGGSTDNTIEIARSNGSKIILEARKGYGRALLTGMEQAQGQIFVWMDGDATYPGQVIPDLIQPIIDGNADIVMGSRLRGKLHESSMSPLNRYGNVLLSLLYNFLFHKGVSDTQCGLRAISKRCYEKLRLSAEGMPLATQILTQAALTKSKIKELSIEYFARRGISKLSPIRDGLKIAKLMFKERFNL